MKEEFVRGSACGAFIRGAAILALAFLVLEGASTSCREGSSRKVFASTVQQESDPWRFYESELWRFAVVDTHDWIAASSSIAVDSHGSVHIAYFDYSTNDLKYATNATGEWTISQMERRTFGGKNPSIALDSNGCAHVAHTTGFPNYRLLYSTNRSGSWQTRTLERDLPVASSAIAVDSRDDVHIAYQNWADFSMVYMTNRTGSWEEYVVDSEGKVGGCPCIAVDQQGVVHISYHDFTHVTLRYANNRSGQWETQTVGYQGSQHFEGTLGCGNSLAVDSRFAVHICYWAHEDDSVRYVTNASGTWETTTLEEAVWYEPEPSIAVDSQDSIHITYFVRDEFLRYAFGSIGDLEISTIKSRLGLVATHSSTSVALDASDNVHICFHADAPDLLVDLIYATNAPVKKSSSP